MREPVLRYSHSLLGAYTYLNYMDTLFFMGAAFGPKQSGLTRGEWRDFLPEVVAPTCEKRSVLLSRNQSGRWIFAAAASGKEGFPHVCFQAVGSSLCVFVQLVWSRAVAECPIFLA